VSLAIRSVRPGDEATVFALVLALAEYERLTAEVDATQEMLADVLFAKEPRVFCDLAEWNGEPVGFALWFLNFSSFRGRHGIYLEDIFVQPEHRGQGIGKALLQKLAQICTERGYSRLEWSVLDWNTPSIDFYKSLGAMMLDEWSICRLTGAALTTLARESRAP
jgi:GNAT superfamily N-acetyltransferase